MSAKYANLPDIDTAPDIYETEDAFPSSQVNQGDSSEDEAALPTRLATRGKNGEVGKEELDSSHLIGTEQAVKKFRQAEKRRERSRLYYEYPASPDSPSSPSHSPSWSKPLPLSYRLRSLQNELALLETELADPSNPLLHKEREEDNVDPGELIRGLVDVKARLEKISKRKEGRGKLVSVVLGEGERAEVNGMETEMKVGSQLDKSNDKGGVMDVKGMAGMDKRVAELETLLGSSTTTLDEASPLPPPLLPLITRLNNQLQILTQPRHIDSISRRLKLLLSDLDRATTAQHRDHSHTHRRRPSQTQQDMSFSPLADQLLPLLSRLGPSLPHIPHILTRLRTLSALHASAGEFQSTLETLEEEQKRMRETLGELKNAVETVEGSLQENRGLVNRNVGGLEDRVEGLLRRLEGLTR